MHAKILSFSLHTTLLRFPMKMRGLIEYFHPFPKEYRQMNLTWQAKVSFFYQLANLSWINHAGALVAVNCHNYASDRKGKSMVAHGVSDEFGDFMVDLPSYLHAIPNLEKICTVKVHQIPKRSLCRPAHRVNKHKGLISLSSVGNGIRTYDAGNIRIQHSTSKPLHALPREYGGKEVIRN